MKKVAFTLAEVLITLTIIGIIAALTIPNLLQSYRKHQVEVGVKEAYSILSNAIKMSENDNGNLSDTVPDNLVNFADYIKGDWVNKYLLPYLKNIKDYGADDNLRNLPYVSYYTNFLKMNGDVFTYPRAMRNIVLPNGVILNIFGVNGTSNTQTTSIQFYVDINGEKEPNKLGYDLFIFTYFKQVVG